MRILLTADWHILLHKKNVPIDWQTKRFKMFFEKILELEKDCDIHILAGDVFEKYPKMDEQALFADFANRVKKRTIIIPGNHEATKKGETFLDIYLDHTMAINNPLIEVYTKNTRIEHNGVWFQLFPYGEMQKDKLPKYHEGDILVTHIRGEVPPHITAEYNFEKLRPWKLILIGDLHFRHTYQDYPAYYPGSPMNVVFDRDEDRIYGVSILNFRSIDDYDFEYIDLPLPKLIRRTISVGEEMKKDGFHHVIYEVTGSIDELSGVDNHALLDKKIAHKPKEDSALDLNDMNTREELSAWLVYSKVENKKGVLKEFDGLNI